MVIILSNFIPTVLTSYLKFSAQKIGNNYLKPHTVQNIYIIITIKKMQDKCKISQNITFLQQ